MVERGKKKNTKSENWFPQEVLGCGWSHNSLTNNVLVVSFWPALTVYHIPCKPIESRERECGPILYVWDSHSQWTVLPIIIIMHNQSSFFPFHHLLQSCFYFSQDILPLFLLTFFKPSLPRHACVCISDTYLPKLKHSYDITL